MVVTFTAQWLERVEPPAAGRVEYRDARIPGLVYRVSAGDRRTWYVVYRVRGRPQLKRLHLGDWPRVSLADAREVAARVVRDARGGEDEAEARRREREAPTLQALADAYLERYARRRKKSWALDEHRIRKHLVELGARRACAIRRADVAELAEAIAAKTPVEANRTLTLLRRIYTWAIGVGLVDVNPCTGVERPADERPRDRCLSDQEIRAVWDATGRLRDGGRDAARLVLLTAQRGGEVLSMAWTDVDLEAGWWTLPASKTKAGREHRVPLSAPALAILRARRAAVTGPWVFPSRAGDGPTQKLRGAVRSLRRRLTPDGAPEMDLRGHDLRRTAATKLGELGIPPHVISRILNHSEGGVTTIYNRYSYDAEKREALDRWAGRLEEIVSPQADRARIPVWRGPRSR